MEPVYHVFRSIDTREETFWAWPVELKICIAKLVQNGFYYGGVGKCIACYYCGKKLYARVNPGSPPCQESLHFDGEPGCPFAPMEERYASCVRYVN